MARIWLSISVFVALSSGVLGAPRVNAGGTPNPADLNPTFGEGGIVQTDLGAGERGARLAIQLDGKIVMAARAPLNQAAVLRFNDDGTLDTTFSDDNDGIFTTDQVSDGSDVVIQADGKIVAVGEGENHVFRLTNDGELDNTFSFDGISGTLFKNPEDDTETDPLYDSVVKLHQTSGILVGGTVDYAPDYFAVARYDSDGTVSETFGDEGTVQTAFTGPDDISDQDLRALEVYPSDGGIVGAGKADTEVADESAFALYQPNGEPDKSFSDDGRATFDIISNEDEAIFDVFAQDDGKILAVGSGGQGTSFYFIRLNSDGTRDDSFGDEGVIIYSVDTGLMNRISSARALQEADGSILVAVSESSFEKNVSNTDIWVRRFHADGTPDVDFGDAGDKRVDVNGGIEAVGGLATLEDGGILISGTVTPPPGGNSDLLLIKLGGAVGTQRTFGDVTCNGPADSVDALAIQRDQASLPVNQTQPCPGIGDIVDIEGASEHPWGDVDCDDDVDTVDSLKILRSVAALPVQQTEPCPDIGSQVLVNK